MARVFYSELVHSINDLLIDLYNFTIYNVDIYTPIRWPITFVIYNFNTDTGGLATTIALFIGLAYYAIIINNAIVLTKCLITEDFIDFIFEQTTIVFNNMPVIFCCLIIYLWFTRQYYFNVFL